MHGQYSVSYTHLDVYKRQLQELSSILVKLGCSDGINLDGGGSATLYVGGQWLCGPQSRKLNNMIAVSYTHLDVYKRQVLTIPFSF